MENLTEEQKKEILERFERMKRYDEQMEIANARNEEDIDELVNMINAILKRYYIESVINKTQIRFHAGFIGNIIKVKDKKLSHILFDAIYPKPTLNEYSHYTTFNGACSILANKEFWIFNLLKNFDAEEFKLFYEEHNITGYRDTKETFGIRSDYKSLMAEQFSLCLTSDSNASPALWNYFGNYGTGIKLTFEITVKNNFPDLRSVYYSDKENPKQIPLFKDLFGDIKEKYNSPFNFTYASKIGAFYIHGKFKTEQEYRFLIKRTADDYNASGFVPVAFKDDISYIVVPFQSHLAEFKLKKVSKGPNCSTQNFKIIKDIIAANYTEHIDIED